MIHLSELSSLHCIKYQPTLLSVAVSVARVKAVRDTHLAQQQEKRGCCYYTTNMTWSEVTQDDSGWAGGCDSCVFVQFTELTRRYKLPPLTPIIRTPRPKHPKSATPGYFCSSSGNDCRCAYGCIINS